ncbi:MULTISPECIES: hypothetical protein [Pseudoalteromonas]|nr:hypothetical protein [Pseudoalteromonas shioyasakiensis]
MMHDYMAIRGNSTRACKARKRKEFFKLTAVIGAIVILVATVVWLTTK